MRRSNAVAERKPSRPVLIGMAGLMLGVACGSTIAQDYPTRPIRIVLGFSAGSTTDILARTVGQKMTEGWGQPVLVENRPGAGGISASSAVATATPDGYTLLMVSAGHAATAAMFTKLPYDTLKDFAGVSRIANVPSMLVVSPALGAISVPDLVALARSKPGQLNFSSPGVGSANHLAAELFKTLTGIQAAHVPYKGIPEAMTAVVSGSVQFNFSPVVNILSLSRDGKLLTLAASTGKRSAILPDVKERLLALGADPAPTTPEEFDTHVRAEVAKFKKIVQDAEIKPE